MYDQNFRNQAVKECVNGQSMNKTAQKYGISITALRAWIKDYREMMAKMTESSNYNAEIEEPVCIVNESAVELKSINVNIDGHAVTMSKKDVIRLMEVFYQFDK